MQSTTGMHGPAALPAIATLLRSLSTCPEVYQQLRLYLSSDTLALTWCTLTSVHMIRRLLTRPKLRIGAGNSIEAVKIGEASEPGTATVVFYLPMRCCTLCRMLYVVLDSLWNHALLALYC
jgi:hypothetical protein